METKNYLKDPSLMGNYNAYTKYVPVGACVYHQYYYEKLFKNGRWPALTDITVTEGNTPSAQETDDNGNPPCADCRKCCECGGNCLCPDIP